MGYICKHTIFSQLLDSVTLSFTAFLQECYLHALLLLIYLKSSMCFVMIRTDRKRSLCAYYRTPCEKKNVFNQSMKCSDVLEFVFVGSEYTQSGSVRRKRTGCEYSVSAIWRWQRSLCISVSDHLELEVYHALN